MGIATPFHTKTSELCQSMGWKEWAGYFAVTQYGVSVDPEYFAIREAAGLLDITPLYKYDISGNGATALLDYVLTRDVTKVKVGQVAYSCWCDERGKIIDDGAIFRLEEQRYRLTCAEPNFLWLSENADGFDVAIEDVSQSVCALALQGPRSFDILHQASEEDLSDLKYFWCRPATIGKASVLVSRTGYTGDLGYEIWLDPEAASAVYDALMKAGAPHGITAQGLNALDMARVEAGYIMAGVDFVSSFQCLTEAQTSTPFELGLDWMLHLQKKSPFVGRQALLEESRSGPRTRLVGIEMDMRQLEGLFEAQRLPVHLPTNAWRGVVPIYDKRRRQVGRASSGLWSPLLKRNLALATVEARYAEVGTVLQIETLVEFERELVRATVVERPFYDPPRRRAAPKVLAAH